MSLVLWVCFLFSSPVIAHNWLKAPKPRNGGTDQQNKPCDGDTALTSPVIVSAGASVALEWSTNHNGDHIMKLVHESDLADIETLSADDPKLLLNQNFPNDIPTGTVTMPETLEVGEKYVLQYIWGSYRNCVDLHVLANIPSGWTAASTDLKGNAIPAGSNLFLSPNGMGILDATSGTVECMEGWDAVQDPPGCVLSGLEPATAFPDGSPIENGAQLYTTRDQWGTYDLLTASVTCMAGYDPTWDKLGCVPKGFEAVVADYKGTALSINEVDQKFVTKDGFGLYDYTTKEITCQSGFKLVPPPRNSLASVFPSCEHQYGATTSIQTSLKFVVEDGYQWPEGGNMTLMKILSIAIDSWDNQTWVDDTPTMSNGILTVQLTFVQPEPSDGFKAYSAGTIFYRLQRLLQDRTLDLRNEFAVNSVRSKNLTIYPELGLNFNDGYYKASGSSVPELPQAMLLSEGGDYVLTSHQSRARITAAILISIILLLVVGLSWLKYDDISMRLELVYANVGDDKLGYGLMGLSFLAFLFSLAALASLVWAKEGGTTFSLWKMCLEGGECTAIKDATNGLGFIALSFVRLFIFIAFFSSMAATVCASMTVIEFGDEIKGATFAVPCLSLCAAASFVAMGLYPAYMDDVLDEFPGENPSPGVGQGLNALCWLTACFAYTISVVNEKRYARAVAKAGAVAEQTSSTKQMVDAEGQAVDPVGIAQVTEYAV